MATDALTTHWRKLYENKYLGAWDLWQGNRYLEITATIDRVTQEEVIGEKGRKSYPILMYLSGRKGPIKMPMILSKTSGKTLQAMFGEVPANWVGKQITLCVVDKNTKEGAAKVLTIRNTGRRTRLMDRLNEEPRAPIEAENFDEPKADDEIPEDEK